MTVVFIEDGDILNSVAQTVVNPVNCVGVMGAGVALQLKKRYPDQYRRYVNLCLDQKLRLGRPMIDKNQAPWIVQFPTKNHFRHPARLWAIEQGLDRLRALVTEKGIVSIAIPALGCGNGGLTWNQVAPAITYFANNVPIPCFMHAPR